jgi:hypothetical protein
MKNGLRWLDSDMHLAEPWDLWHRYIDSAFRDQIAALTGVPPGYHPLMHGPVPGIRDIRKGRVAEFAAYLNAEQTHIDPAGQLRAMDREGIDAAVLFPTVALRSPSAAPSTTGCTSSAPMSPRASSSTPSSLPTMSTPPWLRSAAPAPNWTR